MVNNNHKNGENTPKGIIQKHLDDIDSYIRLCKMEELAVEVNHLSDYLRYQVGRDIITINDYHNYKIELSFKIDKINKKCECNVRHHKMK